MGRVSWLTGPILFLSIAVFGAALAVVVFVSPDDELSAAAAIDVSGSPVATGANELNEEPADGGSEPASSDLSAALDDEDPIAATAALVCYQLRNGATVEDAANWFESGWDRGSKEAETVFRQIVEHALTQECVDVVPTSD